MAVKAVELIVSGKVQKVGYREFVAGIAQELGLAGFVENLKDGTVRIRCKGEIVIVDKFMELINVKNPPETPLIDVKNITEKQLKEIDVAETVFEERYGDPNIELLQAVSTGTRYIGHLSNKIDNLGVTLGKKIDAGFNKTNERLDAGFGKMDVNFQQLSDKYGKISTTLEKIDKNIEKVAKKGF